jgi:hypothetical protein
MEKLIYFKKISILVIGGLKMMSHLKSKLAVLMLSILLLSSAATAQDDGSKVKHDDPDESMALSPFFGGPQFAFIDLNNNGLFEPGDPVYININPADGIVSENDVRVTTFADALPAGTQVMATDPDHDKALIRFGTGRYPAAELRYFDMDGDKSYSLIDPVYLDLNPGSVTAGDIRITGYPLDRLDGLLNYLPGSRVRDSDLDSDKPTNMLPGTFSFYNYDGNINNGGWAIYGTKDIIYMDTQFPFNAITVNDIRMSI